MQKPRRLLQRHSRVSKILRKPLRRWGSSKTSIQKSFSTPARSKKSRPKQRRPLTNSSSLSKKKYKPVIAERDGLKASLVNEIVGGNFSRSKFIAEKLAIPADIAQARFGSRSPIEEGNKIVAKDSKGNNIFSRARPGEIAEFDEALEVLVDQYPYRDNILKGSGASGGGAGGSNGGGGGKKTMTRAQFDGLDPAAKIATAKDIAIVD